MILQNISKEEFNCESSDVIKISFSEHIRAYYSLNTSNNKIFFACSSDIVKPIFLTFKNYIFIGIDLKVFIIDIDRNRIIQEIELSNYFIDFIETNKQIIVISELELLVVDKANVNNIESKGFFDDVVMEYKLLNQSEINLSLQNGDSFDLEI